MTEKLKLLTPADLARRFGVAESTARAWCARGLFPNAVEGPATGRGRIWLVPESDLDGWERPRVGYPKGRPRHPEAGDSDQGEVTE